MPGTAWSSELIQSQEKRWEELEEMIQMIKEKQPKAYEQQQLGNETSGPAGWIGAWTVSGLETLRRRGWHWGCLGDVQTDSRRLSMIFSRLAFPHFWYQPDWCFVMGLSRPKMMKALSNSAEVSEERMHFWVEVPANIRSLWNGTNGSNMSLSLQACLSRPVEHLNVAIAFSFYVCRYFNTQTCRTCRMNQTYIEFDRASLNMIFSFFSIPDLLPDEVMQWRCQIAPKVDSKTLPRRWSCDLLSGESHAASQLWADPRCIPGKRFSIVVHVVSELSEHCDDIWYVLKHQVNDELCCAKHLPIVSLFSETYIKLHSNGRSLARCNHFKSDCSVLSSTATTDWQMPAQASCTFSLYLELFQKRLI